MSVTDYAETHYALQQAILERDNARAVAVRLEQENASLLAFIAALRYQGNKISAFGALLDSRCQALIAEIDLALEDVI